MPKDLLENNITNSKEKAVSVVICNTLLLSIAAAKKRFQATLVLKSLVGKHSLFNIFSSQTNLNATYLILNY